MSNLHFEASPSHLLALKMDVPCCWEWKVAGWEAAAGCTPSTETKLVLSNPVFLLWGLKPLLSFSFWLVGVYTPLWLRLELHVLVLAPYAKRWCCPVFPARLDAAERMISLKKHNQGEKRAHFLFHLLIFNDHLLIIFLLKIDGCDSWPFQNRTAPWQKCESLCERDKRR